MNRADRNACPGLVQGRSHDSPIVPGIMQVDGNERVVDDRAPAVRPRAPGASRAEAESTATGRRIKSARVATIGDDAGWTVRLFDDYRRARTHSSVSRIGHDVHNVPSSRQYGYFDIQAAAA